MQRVSIVNGTLGEKNVWKYVMSMTLFGEDVSYLDDAHTHR